ncbi:MAG: esterase family protein [Lachnospiraceae bacterium]|nr:esterase family protein [Lachnospiraceae bacterium]
MALIDIKLYSEALGMQTEVYVVIPQKSTQGEIGITNNVGDTKYKCLYLLHGLSDDHSIWLRRTSVERYASDYGICVVMPCGHKSFYTDMKYGNKYYTYIAKELPCIIQELFKVSNRQEDNFIAGLSMGGYGALKIALKERGKFCAAAGLSSVADIRRKDFEKVQIPIWGENREIPAEDDLFSLVEQCNEYYDKPRLFMAIGTEDFMYQDNVRLKEKIKSLDYDYTYYEAPGTHCWEFWDEYIQYVLEWMFKL